MKKRVLLLLVAGLALGLLASCEIWDMIVGDGGGVTISGRIRPDAAVGVPPAGAMILVGIIDYAPVITDATTSLSLFWDTSIADNPLSKPYGSQVPYEFTHVTKGQYLVVAWIDLNRNGAWETNEASGTFPMWLGDTPQLRDFQNDMTSADITLYPGGGGSTTVSISGTITASAGVTAPTGTTVFVGLFDVVPDPAAGTGLSTAVTPNPRTYTWAGGTPIPYSFTDVPADDYMVVAWIDLDGDDGYDSIEPSGTFPEWADPPVLQTFSSSVTNAYVVLWANPLSAPASPVPANNATGVDMMTMKLDWADCTTIPGSTVTYDIYVAESAVPAVKYNTTPLPVSEWTIPAAFLVANKVYKWKVVAHDSSMNTTTGPEWTFTTATAAAPTHYIQNWDFQEAGSYDSPSVYHQNTDVVMDVVPGWTFSVGRNSAIPNFEINIGNEAGNNYVILKQSLTSVDGNAISMMQGGTTSIDYSITSSSTLTVRFQIRNNGYGNTMFYDCSPFDVRFKVDGKWYMILIKSDSAHVAGTEIRPDVGVDTNQWYTTAVALDGYTTLQMHGGSGDPAGDPPITLSTGTVVQAVWVYAHNDYYETWIDFIDITQ